MSGDIIIRPRDDGMFEVWRDGKTTGPLEWGEMVAQLVSIVGAPRPPLGQTLYAMKSPGDWPEHWGLTPPERSDCP